MQIKDDRPFHTAEAPMKREQNNPTVLIVDDDPTTTRILEQLLRGAGLETRCAHDLATAETMVRTSPVTLMLLDVHLPDGNGLAFCGRMKADARLEGIPILFISSNDDVAVKVQGFTAGAVDYITKPLEGAEILARVSTHLRLRAVNESLIQLQTERIQRLVASQQSLMPLPAHRPEAGFHVCLRQALRAGGDFYDVIPTGNRVTDFVVTDASGHDLGVSLWTAAFKALLTEYATVLRTPQEICRMINLSLRKILPEGAYFTALYARLNRAANRLTLVSAAHPPAILVSRRTGEAEVLQQEGDVVGIFPDAHFGQRVLSVQPGDRLFLYSDGLLGADAARDLLFSRISDLCMRHLHLPLAEAVSVIVESMNGMEAPEDDVLLMGVEV